jgi:hypothetical protein
VPITVLNPTSRGDVQPLRLARPLASLDGQVIGVLDNGKVNSDRILQYAAEILRERYHVREVLWRRKHDFSRPAPAALLAELSACDAIIAGIGD